MVSFYHGYKQFPSCIVCLSTKVRQFIIFCGFLYSQLMVRNLFASMFEKLKFNVQLLTTLTRCRCGWWRGCCRWGGCCGDFAAVIWNYSGRLFRRNLVISSEERSYDGSKWWKSLGISFFSGSCVCIVKVLSALVSFVLLLLVILNEVMILNFRTTVCLEA